MQAEKINFSMKLSGTGRDCFRENLLFVLFLSVWRFFISSISCCVNTGTVAGTCNFIKNIYTDTVLKAHCSK